MFPFLSSVLLITYNAHVFLQSSEAGLSGKFGLQIVRRVREQQVQSTKYAVIEVLGEVDTCTVSRIGKSTDGAQRVSLRGHKLTCTCKE